MIYNPNIGKLYDTIFFLIEYFNSESIFSEMKRTYGDNNLMQDYYERIKKKVPDVPQILTPLFYRENKMAAPVSVFFSKHTDMLNDNIDIFLDKLQRNSASLYQYIVNAIFSSYSNNENEKLIPLLTPGNYIDAINTLDLPDSFKLQIALLFGNFNYVIILLIDTMRIIYKEVDILHCSYANEISNEFEQIQTDENLKLYTNEIKYDNNLFHSTVVSISLLNQYIIYSSDKTKDNIFLLLGLKHEESILDEYNESFATADNFILTCGSEIRMKIIHALIDNIEMTATQISKYIEIPPTSLIRHLETLSTNNIIYISKRSGLKIFYKLNLKMLEQIKYSLIDLFNKILKQENNYEKEL